MQSRKMRNRCDREKDIPCQSMPNLLFDCEDKSSLNPNALEFIPSYLKSGQSDYKRKQNMKTEATSTTTLVQREHIGYASYLQAQRQLFELLHQLGEKFMPLKEIKVSLAPDGQGINVQFKAEHGFNDKQMLDESLCQLAALHLDLSDGSSISRRLPNVLAANFMARMGDVLKDKMEWNEDSACFKQPQIGQQPPIIQPLLETKRKFHSCSMDMDLNLAHQIGSTPPTVEISKKQMIQDDTPTTYSKPCKAQPSVHRSISPDNTNLDISQGSSIVQQETKYDTGVPTSCPNLGQTKKKGLTGVRKPLPRSTYTSQMRQLQIQKRFSLPKALN